MASKQEIQRLDLVIKLIQDAGYDPYTQLTGYVTSKNTAYITRHGNARRLVQSINMKLIEEYLANNSQMRLM